jgi:hypothetical protein
VQSVRKEVPFALSLIFAAFRFVLEAFEGPYNYALASGDKLLNAMSWAMTFMSCGALFLGALNLIRIHSNNIRRKRPHWQFSVYLLAILIYQSIMGLATHHTAPVYAWPYNAVYLPLDATMFSLLAFYIASAAYRAFRVRNVDAAVMLASAFILMMGNVPIGEVIWGPDKILGGFAGIKNWILRVPNAAGNRAITLGIFLGIMATQSRILLGIERRHLGQD